MAALLSTTCLSKLGEMGTVQIDAVCELHLEIGKGVFVATDRASANQQVFIRVDRVVIPRNRHLVREVACLNGPLPSDQISASMTEFGL